jgi:hypothetical protein
MRRKVPFKWLLINLIAAWKTTSRWGGAATEFLNELLRHSTKDMFSLRQGGGEVEDNTQKAASPDFSRNEEFRDEL